LATIDLLQNWTQPQGLLAVGEPFWADDPTPEVKAIHDPDGNSFVDLGGTLDRITSHGYDLIEMLIASPDDWDRYQAEMWPNLAAWLDTNPDHALAGEVRQGWHDNQRSYLHNARRSLGWGVFVIRPST